MTRRHTPSSVKEKPRSDSLRRKLADYFDANPDEELTIEMIQLKYSASVDRTYSALRDLGSLGLIEYVHIVRRADRGRFSAGESEPGVPAGE